VTTPNEQNT